MLIPEKEGKPVTYKIMDSLPNKIEVFSGKLEGASAFLELSIYNIGLQKFVEGLPLQSKKVLREILNAENEKNENESSIAEYLPLEDIYDVLDWLNDYNQKAIAEAKQRLKNSVMLRERYKKNDDFKNNKLTLSKKETEAINALYLTIHNELAVSSIVLFGSNARRDSKEYSDVNILVLSQKNKTREDRERLSDIASDINIEYGVALCCLYFNDKDWACGNNVNPVLKENIIKEGIVLFGEYFDG
jgi:predicted nucleotidyltransferase